MGLLPTNCIGTGTDGCSLMSCETCGAIHEIKKEAVNAVRGSCFSHALNLSLSKASSVQSVRNFMGIIVATMSFFYVVLKTGRGASTHTKRKVNYRDIE